MLILHDEIKQVAHAIISEYMRAYPAMPHTDADCQPTTFRSCDRRQPRKAIEGERDPARLHDGALEGLLPAGAWREGRADRGMPGISAGRNAKVRC